MKTNGWFEAMGGGFKSGTRRATGGARRGARAPGRRARRRFEAQRLETRTLLAADLEAGWNYDVDHDGVVAPLDALAIVNVLDTVEGPFAVTADDRDWDVNRDGYVTTSDVDAVMAQLDDSLSVGDTPENAPPVMEGDTDGGAGLGGADEGITCPDDSTEDAPCGPGELTPDVWIWTQVVGAPAVPSIKERITKPDPNQADGYFYLELSHPVSYDITVQVTIDGQTPQGPAPGFATNGVDHSQLSNTVKIPAGQKLGRLPVLVNNDQFVEGPEKIRVLIEPGDGYHVAAVAANAEMTIEDNDQWAWVAQDPAAKNWNRVTDLNAWDIDSIFGGLGIADPEGWCRVVGGSMLTPVGDGVQASVDANFHGWRWNLPFWRAEVDALAMQTLDLKFDFDRISGNIFVVSGSGVSVGSPGAEYAKNQELMTGLGYAYQINNGFTPTEHQVRVSVNGVVGVDGTVTTGVSGGVQAGGKVGSSTSDGTSSGELSASGSLGLTFMETTSRSYTVLQDTVEYVLRLKVVEKD